MDRGRDMKKTGDGMTLGLVVGNRDVFPTALAAEGRKEILNVLKKAGVKTVSLAAGGPEGGLVSGYRDAKKCAALFDRHRGKDPDKAVLFHCSNCPRSMLTNARVGYNVIADSVIGKDRSFTTCHGCLKAGPLTFARVSTDATSGQIVGYVGEGKLTDDPIESFGGLGVVQIDHLQPLLRFLCRSGFEHHMALTQALCAGALFEAFTNHLGWDIYYHNG